MMSDATRAALKRFGKVILAAVGPVLVTGLVGALADRRYDWKPLAISVATAGLLALQKFFSWTDTPQ